MASSQHHRYANGRHSSASAHPKSISYDPDVHVSHSTNHSRANSRQNGHHRHHHHHGHHRRSHESGAISFLSEADLQRGRRSRQQFIVEDLIIEPNAENDIEFVLEGDKAFLKKSQHQVRKADKMPCTINVLHTLIVHNNSSTQVNTLPYFLICHLMTFLSKSVSRLNHRHALKCVDQDHIVVTSRFVN